MALQNRQDSIATRGTYGGLYGPGQRGECWGTAQKPTTDRTARTYGMRQYRWSQVQLQETVQRQRPHIWSRNACALQSAESSPAASPSLAMMQAMLEPRLAILAMTMKVFRGFRSRATRPYVIKMRNTATRLMQPSIRSTSASAWAWLGVGVIVVNLCWSWTADISYSGARYTCGEGNG